MMPSVTSPPLTHRGQIRQRRPRRHWLALPAALVLLGASACSSSDSGSDDSSSGDTDVSAFETKLATWYEGTNKAPEGEPVPASVDKTVWFISCGQAAVSCSAYATGAAEAAEEIGWSIKVFDGKLNPTTYDQGVRQAVAAKADGIIVGAIDCQAISGALVEANAAGIPVVGVGGADCADDAKVHFDSEVVYADGGVGTARAQAQATARADWIIAKRKGKAHVVTLANEEALVQHDIAKAFEAEMKECPGCTVERQEFPVSSIGPKLASITQQALLKNPDTDAVHIPTDGIALGGAVDGIRASGSRGKLLVASGEGQPEVLELIAEGGAVDVAAVSSPIWQGWAAVDTLNSTLAGQPARNSGIGVQLVDKDHNLSASGEYELPVDFRAKYRELWGK